MIAYNQFPNSPSWVQCTPRPRCTRRLSSAGTQLRTDDNCKITDDDSSFMRMIWRTTYNHDYFRYGDFSKRIAPHWEDTRTLRSTLDRSRARSLARSCTCSQVSRHLGQIKSFAMLSKKEEGVLVFCKSQHCLGQQYLLTGLMSPGSSWVILSRGSFDLFQISTGQRWKPVEVLVARDPAEAEPKWTKSNGNIISPEILVLIFQLDTQANTSIWYYTNLKVMSGQFDCDH